MTRQTVDELYDDAKRINPDVEKAMEEWQDDHPNTPWSVEYEIPAETGGWIYYGDGGGAITCAYWGNQYPNPTKAVVVTVHPTHPDDKSRDYATVTHIQDTDNFIDTKTKIEQIEGEQYRTPLHVRRRMFWQGVERAIEWMKSNPSE